MRIVRARAVDGEAAAVKFVLEAADEGRVARHSALPHPFEVRGFVALVHQRHGDTGKQQRHREDADESAEGVGGAPTSRARRGKAKEAHGNDDATADHEPLRDLRAVRADRQDVVVPLHVPQQHEPQPDEQQEHRRERGAAAAPAVAVRAVVDVRRLLLPHAGRHGGVIQVVVAVIVLDEARRDAVTVAAAGVGAPPRRDLRRSPPRRDVDADVAVAVTNGIVAAGGVDGIGSGSTVIADVAVAGCGALAPSAW
eukprot:CAMPEP_0174840518 /NCGR_PEP_ID=MMETSP1114-20130205/8731_1 /TAXON_ID=312471 /ORGANISM="Neobodo designis, Strain CCAP 1951/1" /LENGTH=253 /DNA_ID=CAMNT_0016074671 /DNA_START=180 /DNA_END=942 /DNA_ORIENTATION=-